MLSPYLVVDVVCYFETGRVGEAGVTGEGPVLGGPRSQQERELGPRQVLRLRLEA